MIAQVWPRKIREEGTQRSIDTELIEEPDKDLVS